MYKNAIKKTTITINVKENNECSEICGKGKEIEENYGCKVNLRGHRLKHITAAAA